MLEYLVNDNIESIFQREWLARRLLFERSCWDDAKSFRHWACSHLEYSIGDDELRKQRKNLTVRAANNDREQGREI
ncbi:unnamed protein product [Clonostachys rosea f. rosea IK726]|uniref:Uncharacterized protein n=1 Tax=Clonostachys rosea f. rosea IK726 TaxID=1349383 RepID=A0ACA9UTC3_BIOOC|nr:unnamed protein product [Clonostachys rosea f. rosea IK726]